MSERTIKKCSTTTDSNSLIRDYSTALFSIRAHYTEISEVHTDIRFYIPMGVGGITETFLTSDEF